MTESRHPVVARPARDPGRTHGEGELFDPAGHRPTGRRVAGACVAASLVLALLFAVGFVPRWLHRAAMKDDERKAAAEIARVRVARATRSETSAGLSLPGSVAAAAGDERLRARQRVRAQVAGRHRGEGHEESGARRAGPAGRRRGAAPGAGRRGAGQGRHRAGQDRRSSSRGRPTSGTRPCARPVSCRSRRLTSTHAANDAQQANLAAAEAAYGSAQANVRRLHGAARLRDHPRRRSTASSRCARPRSGSS